MITADGVRAVLNLAPAPTDVAVEVGDRTDERGHVRWSLEISCPDGDCMPADLLVPHDAELAPGVLVFHQHAAQWHLGKSEVSGLAGDPAQAFGPVLADAGLVVLAPDAIGFEDRRRTTSGTTAHPDDRDQHERELSYRLLRGETLASKVLADAETALSALRARPEVDHRRVGVVGHSFGGNTVLFHAAVDTRVRFAATSGAAGTYRGKRAHEVGIDRAEVIPGVLDHFDIDDLARLVAPRPMAIFAGDDDRYALDAADVAAAARPAYAAHAAEDSLHVEIIRGGHALTPARQRAIVEWVTMAAHQTVAEITDGHTRP